MANATAAGADASCLRASQYTGNAPRPTASACATRSMFALGQTRQSGANSTRIGSTCAASREIWSPCRSVTRRGWPCAVDQTAWIMFPMSNRPVENAS